MSYRQIIEQYLDFFMDLDNRYEAIPMLGPGCRGISQAGRASFFLSTLRSE